MSLSKIDHPMISKMCWYQVLISLFHILGICDESCFGIMNILKNTFDSVWWNEHLNDHLEFNVEGFNELLKTNQYQLKYILQNEKKIGTEANENFMTKLESSNFSEFVILADNHYMLLVKCSGYMYLLIPDASHFVLLDVDDFQELLN